MGKSSDEVTVDIRVEKLANLVHNDKNPRFIKNKKKHEELLKSLREFPEMKLLREIVVDENLLILAGDKRAYALEELGYTDVTIKQVFNLTDKQKREFIIKDNVHAGEWDTNIIANEWDIDEMQDWGLPPFKMDGLGGGGNDDSGKDNYQNHGVTCPNCGEHFELSEATRD